MLKILVTNYYLREFAGSELNCLTIAEKFKRENCEVEIFTYDFGEPLSQIVKRTGITVHDYFDEAFTNRHYDLIWAHHKQTLSDCLFLRHITADKIIYSSLSPNEPLEDSPCYANCLTLCLANSEETRNQMIKEGINSNNIFVFPNYATSEYFKNAYDQSKIINKICVISNHVPMEVRKFGKICKEKGIHVDFYGINDTYKIVNYNLLKQYDCVITIGKTVQYAMAMGLPVYCYDRFGGQGWIDKNNVELGRQFNFSGRGFNRVLSADKLYVDIVEKYKDALENIDFLKEYAKSHFSFDVNFKKIFNSVCHAQHDISLDDLEMCALSTKRDTALYKQMYALKVSLIANNKYHEEKHKEYKRKYIYYENNYQNLVKKYDELLTQCKMYKNSKSWKVTKPLRWVGRKIK
jgi:hypothetical protein